MLAASNVARSPLSQINGWEPAACRAWATTSHHHDQGDWAMSHVPHELADELPEHKDLIHTLKTTNAHFARLFDEYHETNREIHRVEAAGVNITDEHHDELKRKRLLLKDEMFSMLQGQ